MNRNELYHVLRSVCFALCAGALSFGLFLACGSDEEDVEDLDGNLGSVPGKFVLRLANFFTSPISSLESQINTLFPGSSAKLVNRFADDDDEEFEEGTSLADLLKLDVPGTNSEFINQQLFQQLTTFQDAEGRNYFEAVDTQKYTNTTYAPAASDLTDDYEKQYYLEMIGWQTAVADESVTTKLANATPVVVAVLDTGVLSSHEDLQGVMWSMNFNGQEVMGYNAVTKTPYLKSQTSTDADGHGTHVAGIIGANGANALGIHGVGYLPGLGGDAARSVTEIMNVKVLNDNGSGTSEQISDGIKWAVDRFWEQKAADTTRANQKLVINMSLGGPFETSGYAFPLDENGEPILTDDIFNYATHKNDVVIVVAAGNETCGIGGTCDVSGRSFSKTFYYPCSYRGVLCVAASTDSDTLAGFSNRLASVGVVAPGYQIRSTAGTGNSDYAYYSGTSQATPVTAGAAALLWSLNPGFTSADIIATLQKSSAPIEAIKTQVNAGFGRIDLVEALTLIKTAEAQGVTPANLDYKGSGTARSKEAPPGGPDPNAPSSAQRSKSKKNKKGSGGGCGVIGLQPNATAATWLLFFFAAIFPSLLQLRRR